jgi:hypothetical protein
MVYSLGKVFWYLFGGVGETGSILAFSPAYESSQEFADFRRTPKPLQHLIQCCTVGAREWDEGRLGIFRQGGRIIPRGNPNASVDGTKHSVKRVWHNEVKKMECLLAAR